MGVIRLYNWLSIDICLGVLVSVWFVNDRLPPSLYYYHYTAFFLTVFCIYNLDHLLDSLTDLGISPQHRRLFFRDNRIQLWFLLGFGVLTDCFFILKLPLDTFLAGVLLGLVVIVYLLLVHIKTTLNPWLKEILIAFVYSMSIHFIVNPFRIGCANGWLSALCYFGLALQNIILIHVSETQEDKRTKSNNLINSQGYKLVYWVFNVCSFVSIVGILIFSSQGDGNQIQAGGFLLMTAWNVGLLILAKKVNELGVLRPLAEMVFIWPSVFMLLER